MNTNNLFNSLLKIKNQLSGSIIKQNDTLNILAYGIAPDLGSDLENIETAELSSDNKVVLTNGEIATLSKSNGDESVTIQLMKTGDSAYSESIIIPLDGTYNLDNINDVLIDGYNTTLADIVNSLNDGEAINETILTVNNMFLNKPSYTVGEVMNVINNLDVKSTNDINQLKQMIINSSTNGELTNYAWAELLQLITNQSYKNINEEQTFTVQSENFFALQTFINTIINVVSTVFTVVLIAVGGVFYALAIALSFILESLSTILATTFDTEYKVNSNATYPGVSGTFYTAPLLNVLYYGNDLATNRLFRIPRGSEDIYFFTQKDKTGSYQTYCQSQMILYYHPERCFKYLRDSIFTEITLDSNDNYYFGTKHALTPWLNSTFNDDEDPRLRPEEIVELINDPVFLKRCVIFNAMMLYIQRITNLCSQSTIDVYVQSVGKYDAFLSHVNSNVGSGSAIFPDNGMAIAFSALGSLLYYYPTDMTKLNSFLDGAHVSLLTKMINDFITISAKSSSVSSESYSSLDHVYGASMYTKPVSSNFKTDGLYTMSTVDGKTAITIPNDLLDYCEVDFIPTEDLVNLPSYASDQVVIAISLIVATITVAAVSAKKISASIKSRKQLRQTRRVDVVNQARKTYLDNPTNENAKLYQATMAKYNYKASLFGWGSYDAANGWVNAPSSTMNSIDINNVDLSSQIREVRAKIVSD